MMTDSRSLNDRELLIVIHDRVERIDGKMNATEESLKRIAIQTENRLSALETKVDERTSPKATYTYGIPAGVAGLLVVAWEAAKKWLEGS